MAEKNIFTKEAIKEYITEQKAVVAQGIKRFVEKGNPSPTLLIVQVGDNPASNKYVKGKIADCEEVGIEATLLKFPEDVTNDRFVNDVCYEIPDHYTTIIQLPVPQHLKNGVERIMRLIHPLEDVDGLKKDFYHYPCTPKGICDYLQNAKGREWFIGKHAVIIGRSDLVGRPLAKMLLDRDCTVTVAHSKTKNLKELIKQADILISATGQMNLITGDDIKPDVEAVINVGFAFDENGKMKGDVDVESVMKVTPNCMPIVGSTGLLTRLALLQNVYRAYQTETGVRKDLGSDWDQFLCDRYWWEYEPEEK